STRSAFWHSVVGPTGRSVTPRLSRRTTLRLGGSLLVLAPLLAACSSSSDAASEANAGYVSGDGVVVEIAPEGRADPLEIRGTTYDGDDFDSTALRGAPLLINVWYASCPPCRVEAPALKAVHSEYSALGVEFVGVNTRDTAGPAAAFEETFGITYPSIPDPDGAVIASMDGSVSPNAVPTTLILDAEGRVAARIAGAADQSTLESLLDTVLAEAAWWGSCSPPPCCAGPWPQPCCCRWWPVWSRPFPRACSRWSPATSDTSPGSPEEAPGRPAPAIPGNGHGAWSPALCCSSRASRR